MAEALSIEPEPLDVLRRRVPAALVKTYNIDAVMHGDPDFTDRPGKHRENVFDLASDGGFYRFIASIDASSISPESGPFLHVSVSRQIKPPRVPGEHRKFIHDLFGVDTCDAYKVVSAAGGTVLHYFWKREGVNENETKP